MADFVPKNQFDPNAPNWTGASRSPDRHLYSADKSFEALFSGAGEAITGAANAAYTGIVEKASDEWKKLFEPVRDAQGVGDATAGASTRVDGSAPTTPAELEGFAARNAKLVEAKNEGRIGNTYYYSQLNSLVKEMKTRYPGFHNEVDAIVQKTTGVVPANALRNALLQELEKNQTEAQRKREQEEKNVDGYMHLWTPSMARRLQETGQKPTWQELQPVVQQRLAEEEEIKRLKAKNELDLSTGNLNSANAQQDFQTTLRIRSSQIMDAAVDSISGPSSALGKSLKSGAPMTPEELNATTVAFAAAKHKASELFDAVVNTPSKDGKSWAEIINDPAKVEQYKKQFMGRWESLEALITSDKTGAATMQARMMQSERNAELHRLLKENDSIRKVGVVAEMPGGKEFFQWYISRDGAKVAGRVLNEMDRIFMTDAAAGQGSLGEQRRKAASEKAGPSFYKNLINNYAEALTRPDISPEIKSNFTKTLFGEWDSLKHFDNKSKLRVFTQLTNPEITKQMEALKEKDPEAWNRYSRWAKRSFSDVFNIEINNVGDAASQQFLDVRFDTARNQFVVAVNEDGLRRAQVLQQTKARWRDPTPLGMLAENSGSLRGYLDSVNRLNTAIRSVEPILKSDNFETGQEMLNLFKGKGMDTQQGKTPPWWSRLGKAVSDAVIGQANASEGPNTFGGEAMSFRSASSGNRSQENAGSATRLASLNASEITNPRGADLDNLQPRMKQLLQDLADEGIVEEIKVASGYRDAARNARAGGAKASRHMDGSAIDIDVSGMSDEEKAAVLDKVIAKGAKGIGIYPSGNSLHIDTRDAPATWGYSPFGRYKGVDWSQQPAWAHGPLKKLFGVKDD